jgi:hypothetical protein
MSDETTDETTVEVDDEKFVVEVVDDRPEEDQVEPASREAIEDDSGDPTEEELNALSSRVQERMKTMTFQREEARRTMESAERTREEAMSYAERVQAENVQLRDFLGRGEKVLLESEQARTATVVEQAQAAYAVAVEQGDPNGIAEANSALNRAQIEAHDTQKYAPQMGQPEQPAQPVQVQTPQQQPVDQRFEQFRKDNEWFDSDGGKRAYAMFVHEDLKKSAIATGVTVGSEAYYSQIDSRMKEAFPDMKESIGVDGTVEPVPNPAPSVVASTARAPQGGAAPRKLVLTTTQANIAKRLNVPLEVYAREQIKLDGGDNG